MKLISTQLPLALILALCGCDSQPPMNNDTKHAPSDQTNLAQKPNAVPLPPTRLIESGWKASFSPDGRRLVYGTPARDGIEILEMAGLKRTTLVASAKDPDWSPDGRFITFVREPAYDAYQAEAVWLCAPDDPQPRRVMAGGFPTWSADGKTLYIHDRRANQLLAVRVDDPSFEPTLFYDRPRSWYPAVSPDGKQIVFGVPGQLEIVDRATGETSLVWPTPGDRGLLLAWSPDGKLIAFRGFEGSTLGLWVLEIASKRAAPVLEGNYTMPAWSKDGSRLAFDQRTANRREVWVVERSWLEARLNESAR